MLKNETKDKVDPLQFAYRHNRGVEDAVLTLIHETLAHINANGSYARILFVDFSSAFNTVQPHILLGKLQDMNICPHLSLWIADFLHNRTQRVCVKKGIDATSSTSSSSSSLSSPSDSNSQTVGPPQTNSQLKAQITNGTQNPGSVAHNDITNTHCFSDTRTINTGTPQGTVISPFIFTLYTNDCRSTHEEQRTIKFSDDTAVVDFTESEEIFSNSVRDFSEWCEKNFLELNVGKTKEMVVDFKTNRTDVGALQIKGQTVERVTEYRYLGTVVDEKFKFKKNTEIIHKKCRQRMVMLYQLRSLMVSNRILMQCYQAFVESILTFSFICWFGSLDVKDRKLICGIANQCGKIVGNRNINIPELYKKRVCAKAMKIHCDPSHWLNRVLEVLPSNRRFRSIRCKTKRFQNTFFPCAIKFLNEEKTYM